MPRFTRLSASTSWPSRNALRTSALVAVALLALPVAADADQIDFESGYVVNTALDGQDGWVFWDLVQLDNPFDFTPRESSGNTVLECVTPGLTEYYRSVDAQDGAVDLVWRWRASSSTASLMFGPADELTQTNNNYASYRIRVQMSNGQWGIKGDTWETPTEPDWGPGLWYYMRIAMDIAAGTYSVYVDTDPNRASETALVEGKTMAGSGTVARIMLKANQGSGTVEIDDIGWGTGAPGGPPLITQQPQDATVSVGQTAAFTVAATGDEPLTYQWKRDGAPIAGATSPSYITETVTLADSGARFSCLVTDVDLQSTASAEAVLRVTEVPVFPGGEALLWEEFSLGNSLEYRGFTSTDYWSVNQDREAMSTGTPGGWDNLAVAVTPEVSADRSKGAVTVEWSVAFPTDHNGPSWREENKLWLSFLDGSGAELYRFLFKPNRTEDLYTSPDMYFERLDGGAAVVVDSGWSHRPTPSGADAPAVHFTMTLGTDGAVAVSYDAVDGVGFQQYVSCRDNSYSLLSSLKFTYKTGTGTSNYFCEVPSVYVYGVRAEQEGPRAVPFLKGFAFGADTYTQTVPGASGNEYVKVVQNGQNFTYSVEQGHGYTDIASIDGSPNNRNAVSCEIYDQFIGAKYGGTIVFRIDVPNGLYRFVVAGGDAQYGGHTTTLQVRDGSAGDVVTLVDNVTLNGKEYYTVAFDETSPPVCGDATFVTQPESPTLEVTAGYIELLQSTSGDGGDVCLFEVWGPLPPASADLLTMSHSFGAYAPYFAKSTVDYTAVVPVDATAIVVSPVPVDPGASVTVNGQDPAEPVDISDGDAVLDVEVTPRPGSGLAKKTYNLTVQKSAAPTLFVDDNSPCGGAGEPACDGSGWGTAYHNLHEALAAAGTAGKPILVGQGTYRPTQRLEAAVPRSETYQIFSGTRIAGGFAGNNTAGIDPYTRDWQQYETVLSGDLDMTAVNGVEADYSGNAYHVVYVGNVISGIDLNESQEGIMLDGLVIEHGNADLESGVGSIPFYGHAGGIMNVSSSMRLNNCLIRNNKAVGAGAGMTTTRIGGPYVTRCVFMGNESTDGTGGGLRHGYYSSPVTEGCVFVANRAREGGAVAAWSSGTLRNCVFYDNEADNGGAILAAVNPQRVTNCVVVGNRASGKGGGIHVDQTGSVFAANSIVWGNTATVNGPQLSADAGIQRPLEVRNCDIEGGIRGTGVSGEFQDYGGNPDPGIDPHFLLQPPNATYNPAGTDGKYFTSDDGFRLQATSPLRDKGRNDPWYPDITAATDMAGAKRVQAYNVDMGAFEATDARKPILLMPLGNSITAGLGDGAVGTRPEDYRDDLGKGYREPLWRLFPVDFVGNSIEVHKTDRGPFSPTDPDLPWPPPDWDVDHMGFPGSGISGIADMFTSYAAGSDMEYGTADDWVFPDVVLLLAGTNDIRQPKVGVTPNDVPVALDKLNEFIELLLEKSPDRNGDGIADVMILVGTIPEFLPDQYFTWRWGEGDVATTKSVSYNAGLMTLPAIVNNANVQLVDIAAAVGSNMSPGKPREGEHTGDGVHPNMIGYEAMANAWYGALMDAGVAESP